MKTAAKGPHVDERLEEHCCRERQASHPLVESRFLKPHERQGQDYADGDTYTGNDTGVDVLVSESHEDTHHHDHECCLEAARRMWNHR